MATDDARDCGDGGLALSHGGQHVSAHDPRAPPVPNALRESRAYNVPERLDWDTLVVAFLRARGDKGEPTDVSADADGLLLRAKRDRCRDMAAPAVLPRIRTGSKGV